MPGRYARAGFETPVIKSKWKNFLCPIYQNRDMVTRLCNQPQKTHNSYQSSCSHYQGIFKNGEFNRKSACSIINLTFFQEIQTRCESDGCIKLMRYHAIRWVGSGGTAVNYFELSGRDAIGRQMPLLR